MQLCGGYMKDWCDRGGDVECKYNNSSLGLLNKSIGIAV